MNWYVGQKVVCIDDSCGKTTGVKALFKGHVYEVLSVRFITMENLVVDDSTRKAWGAYRFRPLDSLSEQMERIESEGAPVEQPEPQHA